MTEPDFEKFRRIKQMHVTHRGLLIVPADDTTLQLDIDTEADLEKAREIMRLFQTNLGIVGATVTRSKSDHWHVYVKLDRPHTRAERLALQACLGSDPKRELMSYLYNEKGGKQDCVLFEKPDAVHEPFEIGPPNKPPE